MVPAEQTDLGAVDEGAGDPGVEQPTTAVEHQQAVLDVVRVEEHSVAGWLSRHSITMLRLALGIVYVWFGLLKFFPHRSPVESLLVRTMEKLSGERVQPQVSRPAIAALECVIGMGLLSGRLFRPTLVLLGLQLAGAMSPLVILRREMFRSRGVPTLAGQYVIKDIVLAAAGLVLAAASRGKGAHVLPRGDAS